MIRQIEFANLKAFRGKHRAELAPLTVIFGSNSAGKSTLIQALLLLKQTVESSDPERPALVVRGSLADLGSIPGIIHGHDLERTLELGVAIDPSRRVNPYSGALGSLPRRYGFSFRWDSDGRAVRQTEARLGLGGSDVAAYTRRRGPAVAQTAEAVGVREYPFRIGRKAARDDFVRWLLPLIGPRLRSSGSFSRVVAELGEEDLIELLVDRVSFAAAPWNIVPAFPRFTLRDKSRGEDDLSDLVDSLEMAWRQRSNAFRTELATTLDSLFYLGPLRRAPARFHIVSGARRTSVGREGEYAAELLSRRPELVSKVNGWLSRLNIPYSLDATTVLEEDVTTTLGDVVVLVLTDVRSGLKVSPGDVGFGISQLLPIVVQTLVGTDSTICVEQPEIHVHPRLQSEVADLLIDATRSDRNNQLIVETHSEHLMLRLQARVREGKIAPERIAVLYVDSDVDGAARIIKLRLDDEGAFIDEWPQGFFEERLAEILKAF
jgi:hypothetical protein